MTMILIITTTMRIIEVNPEAIDLIEAQILVDFSEVKICVVEVNAVKTRTKANIKVTATKVIITKVIMAYTITHIEIFNKVIMDNTQVQIFIDNGATPSILPLCVYNKYPILQKYPKTESHSYSYRRRYDSPISG